MASTVKAQICLSCLKSQGLDESFCQQVQSEVTLRRPDIKWKIETTTCQRVCPENRLTLAVTPLESQDSQLSMSRTPSLEDAIRLILSYAPSKK